VQPFVSTSSATSTSNIVSVIVVEETSDALTLQITHFNPKVEAWVGARAFGCDESRGPCALISSTGMRTKESPIYLTLTLESRAYSGHTTQIEVVFLNGPESDNGRAVIDYLKWWLKP
jgi:hypothetical protein